MHLGARFALPAPRRIHRLRDLPHARLLIRPLGFGRGDAAHSARRLRLGSFTTLQALYDEQPNQIRPRPQLIGRPLVDPLDRVTWQPNNTAIIHGSMIHIVQQSDDMIDNLPLRWGLEGGKTACIEKEQLAGHGLCLSDLRSASQGNEVSDEAVPLVRQGLHAAVTNCRLLLETVRVAVSTPTNPSPRRTPTRWAPKTEQQKQSYGSQYRRARDQVVAQAVGTPRPGCGVMLTRENCTAAHVAPRALGGSSAPANLRPMCAECNHRRGAVLGGRVAAAKRATRLPSGLA